MKRRTHVTISDLPEGVSEIGESDLDLDLTKGGARKQGSQIVTGYAVGSDGILRPNEYDID